MNYEYNQLKIMVENYEILKENIEALKKEGKYLKKHKDLAKIIGEFELKLSVMKPYIDIIKRLEDLIEKSDS